MSLWLLLSRTHNILLRFCKHTHFSLDKVGFTTTSFFAPSILSITASIIPINAPIIISEIQVIGYAAKTAYLSSRRAKIKESTMRNIRRTRRARVGKASSKLRLIRLFPKCRASRNYYSVCRRWDMKSSAVNIYRAAHKVKSVSHV